MQDEDYCQCPLCESTGQPVRYGDCHCGQCDEKPTVSPQTVRKLGYVAGKPRTFVRNHDKRKTGPQYEVDEDGCWLWLWHVGKKGYGYIRPRGNLPEKAAHIYYYEQAKGPVPEGMQLDHLCHTNDPTCNEGVNCKHRRCCNPDHLQPVPPEENNRRGRAGPGSKHKPGRKKKARPTHCKHGHKFTKENTYVRPDGAWTCKACAKGIMAANYQKRKGAKAA